MNKQRGATLVEYSLLVCLVAIISIASLRQVGNSTSCTFKTLGEHVTTPGRKGLPKGSGCSSPDKGDEEITLGK